MSLYSLDSKLKACIRLDDEHVVDTEDGEILDLEQFEALQMERDAKVEGLACYIKTSTRRQKLFTPKSTSFPNVAELRKTKQNAAKITLRSCLTARSLKPAAAKLHSVM